MTAKSIGLKSARICALAAAALMATSPAALAAEPSGTPLIKADWQEPAALPRVLRNHCVSDGASSYCADHCGIGYQVYYCSPHSFGCCRVGFGFCDADGKLHCAP
jgi:hypothetical protein